MTADTPASSSPRVDAAVARLARAHEQTRQARAEFRETRPAPSPGLSFLEHAEIDEAAARTAYYAALDEASSIRRRLSAVSSFYRYCAAHDLVDRIPVAGVMRPVVDPDYTGARTSRR